MRYDYITEKGETISQDTAAEALVGGTIPASIGAGLPDTTPMDIVEWLRKEAKLGALDRLNEAADTIARLQEERDRLCAAMKTAGIVPKAILTAVRAAREKATP